MGINFASSVELSLPKLIATERYFRNSKVLVAQLNALTRILDDAVYCSKLNSTSNKIKS